MGVDQRYVDEASKQYDPQYEARKRALENGYNSNVNDLNNSKTGINANYDTRVKGQNLQNTVNKNNMSNGMLGRGMGRSSIATSGLTGLDTGNTRVLGEINNARTGELNNVDNSIANLKVGLTNSFLGLDAEKMGAINQLAMQLRDKAVEEGWKQKQFDFQQQQASAEAQYRNSQLALQRESMASKQQTEKKASPNDLYATYLNYRDRGEGTNFLKDNRSSIISEQGYKVYQELSAMDEEWLSQQDSSSSEDDSTSSKKNWFANAINWINPWLGRGSKWGAI
ncbi:MAG: hypothetical protein ACRDA5_02300 [Clostridium sp.]